MKTHPLRSLDDALKVAEAVEELGGECSRDSIGDPLKMSSKSGAFSTLIGGARTFGVIDRSANQVFLTPKYKDYKLAYNEEGARQALISIFLNPPLFEELYQKFKGKQLPVDHFSKLLIREHGVRNDNGLKVANIFIKGARKCGILDAQNGLVDLSEKDHSDNEDKDQEKEPSMNEGRFDESSKAPYDIHRGHELFIDAPDLSEYVMRIMGPGVDSTIVFNEEYDLVVAETILKKIRMKLLQKSQENEGSEASVESV